MIKREFICDKCKDAITDYMGAFSMTITPIDTINIDSLDVVAFGASKLDICAKCAKEMGLGYLKTNKAG